MTDRDFFFYYFIYDLGKFFPIKISLLGGRFYASYSANISNFTNEVIADYKIFLQENITAATGLVSTSKEHNIFFLQWITNFIETELINVEYRQIYTNFFASFSETRFSFVLSHIFFDTVLFESLSIEKRLQSFVERNAKLITFFKFSLEHINNLPFSFFFELSYLCDSLPQLYYLSEKYFSTLFIQLVDQPLYSESKNSNLQYALDIQTTINKILRNFMSKDIIYSQRFEIFSKAVEYCLPKNFLLPENTLLGIENIKKYFESDICSKFSFDIQTTNIIAELSSIKGSKKISASDRLTQSIAIFQLISSKLQSISSIFTITPLTIQTLEIFDQFLITKPFYISSSKLKRGESPKWIIPLEDTYESSIYLEISLELIPLQFITEKNNSISYIYQALRLPESEEAIKHFLIYILYVFDMFEQKSTLAAIYQELLQFIELARIDLFLHFHPDQPRNLIIKELMSKTKANEISAEHLLEKLTFFAGTFFFQGYCFLQLFTMFNLLCNAFGKQTAFEKILPLLQKNYGAPIKIFLENIQIEIKNLQ